MISKLKEITTQAKAVIIVEEEMSPIWKKYEKWKSSVKNFRTEFPNCWTLSDCWAADGVHVYQNIYSPQAPGQL